MWRSWALAAALAALLCSGAQGQVTVGDTAAGSTGTPGTYDPCLPPPTGVKRGDPFVFGLAFWPGGKISDWGAPYNSTTGAPGLNPCSDLPVTGADGTSFGSYQEYLTSKGVVFGTYMIKVDTLAAARTTRAEMAQLWAYIQKTIQPDDQVLSVIAFRGENRSEAQYVASASAARSEGTGIVQQLSLMVGWDRGTFAGFTWFNQGPCDMCGGLGNARCVQTQYDANYQKYPESACAWSFEQCTCSAEVPLNCPSNNCTAAIYVGHRGSDKPGRPMSSGYQIEQINKYSLSSFFWKVLDGVFNLLGNSGIARGGGSAQAASAPVVLTTNATTTDAQLAAGQQQQAAQAAPTTSQTTTGGSR